MCPSFLFSYRCIPQTLEARAPHPKPSRTSFVTSESLMDGLWRLSYPCSLFSLSVGLPSHFSTPASLGDRLQNKATSVPELGPVFPLFQDTGILVPTLLRNKQAVFPIQDPLEESQVDRLKYGPCPSISSCHGGVSTIAPSRMREQLPQDGRSCLLSLKAPRASIAPTVHSCSKT